MLNLNLPDTVFEWLFEPDPNEKEKQKGFLEIFNFTIDEASPSDAEVAVDPEMLGKVYESLISSEERGDAGIFIPLGLKLILCVGFRWSNIYIKKPTSRKMKSLI